MSKNRTPNISASIKGRLLQLSKQQREDFNYLLTRLKDFYDIWFLCEKFEFQGELLCEAIKNTFNRRKTALPTILPFALTSEFALDTVKQKQWKSFVDKGQLKTQQISLTEVITIIGEFLMPPSLAASHAQPFNKTWIPSTYWSDI